MSPELRRTKLRTLYETEGYEDENDLFAAAMTDSVCPAICCNPDNPECDYTEEKEPDSRDGWGEECQRGTRSPRSCSAGSSDVGRSKQNHPCPYDHARERVLITRPAVRWAFHGAIRLRSVGLGERCRR